jgi:hypothetical protein
MGISRADLSTPVWDAATGAYGAVVTWETDTGSPVTTELLYGKTGGTMTRMPDIGSCDGTHTYPLTGLTASTDYTIEAVSVDAGIPLACDDGKSPFTRTMPAAPVTAVPAGVTITASSTSVSVGADADITAVVKDASGAALPGVTVEFACAGLFAALLGKIFPWLAPIGTVSPSSADTDAAGRASTVFTAARIGIAVVRAKCGGIEEKVSVVVRR